ncbi:MAG: LytTR family DNA-binding domain-containing protein [Burkholderiales bacterium]
MNTPGAALRVLLVDDEELARLRLRSLLADCVQPAVVVVAEVAHGGAALHSLANLPVDVVLLDVHMPGLDGLQLAQRLHRLPRRPAVVFVTAHAEHALAAFEVEAVDYLTKPVRRARLQEALVRCAHWLGRQAEVAGTTPPLHDDAVIVVHERGAVLRVPLAQVLVLKAEQKYVCLRTASSTHWLDDSLAELAQRLGERFLRVHRNALVARAAVRELARRPQDERLEPLGSGEDGDADAGGWAVRIDTIEEWVTVSRRQLAAVREALAQTGR